MKIPLYSPTICRSEMEAVLNRMVVEQVGPGEMNRALSKAIVEASFPSSYAIPFRSPSIALSFALSALEIKEGSSVILSALAPYWMYAELLKCDINPIVVDVGSDSIFIDIQRVQEHAGKVSAIIVDEPLGFAPDMQAILELNIPIIEDISQSMGASASDVNVGSYGDFAILGLEEHDILTAGGGAVLIANKKNVQASLKKMNASILSHDLLPDINARLALIQLKQAKKNSDFKRELLQMYQKALLQTKHKTIKQAEDYVNPVYSFPVVLASNVQDVEKFVSSKDVEIEKAFKDSVIAYLPQLQEVHINSFSMFLRTFLFPLYPYLGKKKAVDIAKILSVLP